jgi:regulator of ribonuclease activity A
MSFQTADLCDAHEDKVSVAEPMFRSYGGRSAFSGQISTIKCFEDNSRVREALGKPGAGRVLVVDGGGSLRCALLGDQLAALAEENRWSGVVVHGCIRDSEAIARMAVGIRALATHPRKSVKKGAGEADVPVTFGGVTFQPGHYLYADADGIILSPVALI